MPTTHVTARTATEQRGSLDRLPAPNASPRADRKPKLQARGLSKHYGDVVALHPLDLDIHDGELLTLLGPSGSGKTTLLQLICGLVEPSSGQLLIDGKDRTHLPPHQRDMGVVFQSYALFPHLTVRENVAFPLQMRRLAHAAIGPKVDAALAMVGLTGFGARMPDQLSGGQQQRVALARCFVYEPALILMDEPLGALDRKLRENLQGEIRRLHQETGATIVFVTHDQEEALGLSDRICLMSDGRIEQLGTPADIYDRPATPFAASFIGLSNMLAGEISEGGRIATTDGLLPVAEAAGSVPPPGTKGVLVVRPESVSIVPADAAYLSGRVTEVVFAGSETRLTCVLQTGTSIIVRQDRSAPHVAFGDNVHLAWPVEKARFLSGIR